MKASQRNTPAKPGDSNVQSQKLRLALFDHLPRKQTSKSPDSVEVDRVLHSSIVQFGTLLSRGLIVSDDDRAHALIMTFCSVIGDYSTPPNKMLREDLDRYVGKQVRYFDSLP